MLLRKEIKNKKIPVDETFVDPMVDYYRYGEDR